LQKQLASRDFDVGQERRKCIRGTVRHRLRQAGIEVVGSGSAVWRIRCVAELGSGPGSIKPPIMPWAK
jgi:hypothetical protein